jgi:hypothetical protein
MLQIIIVLTEIFLDFPVKSSYFIHFARYDDFEGKSKGTISAWITLLNLYTWIFLMAPVDRVANLPVTDVQSTSVELIAKSVKFTQIFHNEKTGKLLKF